MNQTQSDFIPDPEALRFAGELETALLEMMNGERKANKLPVEPMVRLIAFARTGSTKNASICAA